MRFVACRGGVLGRLYSHHAGGPREPKHAYAQGNEHDGEQKFPLCRGDVEPAWWDRLARQTPGGGGPLCIGIELGVSKIPVL